MTGQGSLFDAGSARDAREAAIIQVGTHADDVWMTKAKLAVLEAAERHAEFTTDEVWMVLVEWGVDPPREERAMGAVFHHMHKRAKKITPTDRHRSSVRPACHARPLLIWKAAKS